MTMKLKRVLILIATALGMLLVGPVGNAPARADLMQCPYPATGFQARVQPLIGEAVGYICNYPIERGLQHLHAELGSYMTGGSTYSPGLLPTGGLGVHLGIGMSLWSQSWRCPDERYIAAPPNGIGAWRDPLNFNGVKCPATERAPLALNAPWPPVDPNIIVVVNQILPPGEPDPTAAPPPDAVIPPPGPPLAPGIHDADPADPQRDPEFTPNQIPLPLPGPGA
jgi:hypothetical protein